MTAGASVPTLTIGGFLGAGKTTLVNHLLKGAEGARVVVFVNDFGAINIDYDLIDTVETDRIALSNGCVCCTLNGDLIRTMVGFCETDPPDLFVIEASGVADPRSLATTLDALHQSGRAHVQRRVYVLDAAHFGRLDYADTEDLIDHAAASDLVLVNKSDLVSGRRLSEIETLLSRSAPATICKVTAHAQVSLSELSDTPTKAPVSQNGTSGRHDATALFRTLSFVDIPPLSADHFDTLTDLLKDTCLRAKGVLHLDNPDQSAIRLQLVGRRLDLQPLAATEVTGARLVTIGWSKRLDPGLLSSALNSAPIGLL